MTFWIYSLGLSVALCLLMPVTGYATTPTKDKKSLLLLLRHANAPGTGDPANFKVSDCSTQRNLDGIGKSQSRQLGQDLQKLGVVPTKIWSSQWCRSMDTATLMNLGPVEPLPLLNSFFQNREVAPTQMRDLRDFIKSLDPKGGPYVMSSHQVVVSDIADIWVQSGDGIWLELTGQPDRPWNIYRTTPGKLSLPEGF